MASKFQPNETTQVTLTPQTWSEYREIFDGQADQLCRRYVEGTYKKAALRGKIRTMHLPITQYVCGVAAGALDLPLRATGAESWRKLARRWRPTISRGWKARYATGSAYVHLARRKGKLELDLLWGDSLKIVADPEAPLSWEYIQSVEIETAQTTANSEKRTLVYLRLDSGAYQCVIRDATGEEEFIEEFPALPIFPMYREAWGMIQPPADRTLLDIHIAASLQMSDIEYRRVYRTSQVYRASAVSEMNKRGPSVECGADVMWELEETDRVGIIESALRPSDDLTYIEGYLQLAAKTLRLPPELFNTHNRSETGAARAWDFRPLLEIQELDRAAADEWMAEWSEYVKPILAGEGVVAAAEKIALRTVAPKMPLPADLLQYAQGVREMMALGLTSPVREVSLREGISFAEAETLVRLNRKQAKLIGPAPTGGPDGEAV